MAITRNTESIGMKVTSNYGEVEGQVVRKSKTYANVKTEATDDAIMATYTAITDMQQPLAEHCYIITTDELVDAE